MGTMFLLLNELEITLWKKE